jgi:4-amino-4-deoxy-L-arabinose transferase-like glycosyltransferase
MRGLEGRRTVIAIAALGLTARLAVAAATGLTTPPPPGSDSAEYDTYAWNVAQGRGYRGPSPDVSDADRPTAYRAPGTSLLWAAFYGVFGHSYALIRIVHCVLGALTVVILLAIGSLAFGRTVGLVAALVYALWPTALLYSSSLLSEVLFTFFLLAYVLVALWFASKPHWNMALLAGGVLGAALLTRPTTLFVLPFAVLWAVWQFRDSRRVLLKALGIPVMAMLCVAPWALRNYLVLGAFVPFSTGGGDVLLGSNNRVVASDPTYYGYWVFPTTALPEFSEALRAPDDEVARDRAARALALEWLRDNPGLWGRLVFWKLVRVATPFLQPSSPALYRWGMLASWGPVLVLTIAGFLPTARQLLASRNPAWLVHMVILHVVPLAAVFWGSSRFRFPIEGLCVLLASAFALTASRVYRARVRGRAS